jgi:N-acetylmuramoyl-L-alanine amidase
MKNELVGIIVDSRHGGLDSGAVGNGLLEKFLTLEAGLYMYDRLKELGIPTEITRVDDSYLPKSDRIEKVLELYNNSPNTILVSNHINSGGGEISKFDDF